MKSKLNLMLFSLCVILVSEVLLLPTSTKDLKDYHQINRGGEETNLKDRHVAIKKYVKADLVASSATIQKSQSFQAPSEATLHIPSEPLLPAAQNYFSSYYRPSIPPLGHSRPYYQATEEPFISKFLTQQHHKQFLPQSRELTYSHYDSSILGSGDFGILRGGTFYSGEDHQEDNTDFYNSEASNAHSGPATEGFIQKYTYPEEQFAQFRDFADLSTPSESAYSQFVVVYAAKNGSTATLPQTRVPNNIFEQLQLIDAEKAAEEGKLKKNAKSLSTTKLKLVKTKIIKKKWNKKNSKATDEDPLLALS